MNLRQLEVFYAVMKTGSITKAAELLKVTQPAISATLGLTEQRLRFNLFDRVRGKLVPTNESKMLFADAQNIYARLQTFNRLVDDIKMSRSNDLVISTTPTLVNTVLPEVISKLREIDSNISISIHSSSTRLAIEKVTEREVDVGLVYGPVEGADIESSYFGNSQIACAMNINHPLTKKEFIHAEDLLPYP